jgi:hypothetical protein
MTLQELAADGLKANLEMLMRTLSDFSDADIYVRPCPGANHTAWQLGHLTVSEANMMGAYKLPEGYDKKFTKETCGKDDPKFFGSKAELLDQLNKTRAATIAWVKAAKPADLDKPAPERMQRMCPTMGHLVGLLPTHLAMHMGQMQVIRRKLGKPILL